MATVPKKTYTPQEYLQLEEHSDTKHEYYQGEIFAMAGASREHNEIARNLFARLFNELQGGNCKAYNSDTRIKIQATGFYTYPDVAVACKPLNYEADKLETLLNPRVLIEVLSPATEDHDLGFKLKHYRKLPSVQEVLFFSQVEPQVDHYIRHGDEWRLVSQTGLDESVEFPSLACQIPMRLIYADVSFPTSAGSEREGEAT